MTVLVIAASDAMAAAVEARLRKGGDWHVVAGLVSHVPALIERDPPHVIVLAQPGPRLMRALQRVREHSEDVPVVLLVDKPRDAWTPQLRRVGVRAVLPITVPPEELAATVHAVERGLIVLHPASLTPAAARPRAEGHPDEDLTRRELEIVDMMAEGLSNQAIARRLGISRHTVKFHVASILAKLEASTRTRAVMTAVRRGLVRV